MDQQESDFLAAAMAVSDPVQRRQLLAGFHFVHAGCRLANGEPVDVHAGVAAAHALLQPDDFAPDDDEFRKLRAVEQALLAEPMDRLALHHALGAYAKVLSLNSSLECGLATYALAARLWDAAGDPLDRLFMEFEQIWAVQSARPLTECRHLPLVHAQRARVARSRFHIGIARYLRLIMTSQGGNLQAALRQSQSLLRWADRHDEPLVRQRAQLVSAIVYGRLGQPLETVRLGTLVLQVSGPRAARHVGAHLLIGNALIDLGLLDEAKQSFELACLDAYSSERSTALSGLMDVAVRQGDEREFRAMRARVITERMVRPQLTVFLRDSAVGLAHFGDVDGARALLEQGRDIAQSLGYGQDYMQIDAELERLAQQPISVASARSASRALEPELASLREHHERASAALMVVLG